jgi:Transcriptional regulator containing PAS, AAA-type ATPase, and DNA-binding domains
MKRQANYSVDSDYPPEVQMMMAEATHCLNCGKKLNYLQRKEGRRNRGFCTLSCYYLKPPKMAYVEKEYGKPVKGVILKMLNDGASIIAVAERLGISKPQFYEWMKKLGIKKKVVWR